MRAGAIRHHVWFVVLCASVGAALVPASAAHAAACPSGTVALTFDDGPGAKHTTAVLDRLAAHDATATFFVVGSRVGSQTATIRRMVRDGHAVANHTWNHENLTRLSPSAVATTVRRTDQAIRAAGVTPLKLVRPPYGATNTSVRNALSGAGFDQILWSVDPRDWETSSSQISSFVLNNLRDGAVVLLHDGITNSGQTVAALPTMLRGIRERGYCFGRLDAAGRVLRSTPPPPPEVDWRTFGSPFRDVNPKGTHGPAIIDLHARRVTSGCGDARYCPDASVSREQLASFLVRAYDLPAAGGRTFRDVSSAHAANVQALVAAGVTRGCDRADPGRFCGSEPVSRQQMASMLSRVLELPPATPRFEDVDPSSTHGPGIGALTAAGITRGCDPPANRRFCPREPVTRAQMASFLVRSPLPAR